MLNIKPYFVKSYHALYHKLCYGLLRRAILILVLVSSNILFHYNLANAQTAPPTGDQPVFFDELIQDEIDQSNLTSNLEFLFYPWGLKEISEEDRVQYLGNVRDYKDQIADSKSRGQIQMGFVQGYLSRENLRAALIDAYRIEDPLWLARALIKISEYLMQQEQLEDVENMLFEAVDILKSIEDDNTNQRGKALENAAALFLTLNDISNAIDVMELIPDPMVRVSALRKATRAALDLESKAKGLEEGKKFDFDLAVEKAKNAILAAITYADALEFDNETIAPINLSLIASLINLHLYDQALEELDILKPKVIGGSLNGRDQNIVDMAANYIQADDAKTAMEMVRELSEIGKRARALGVVARARVASGDIDAATPLFIMAREEAERVFDNDDRIFTYVSLMEDFAESGRLADAFEMAGKIKTQPDQGVALSKMAFILLNKNQYEEAAVLTEYIPQMELRAPIQAFLARVKGLQGKPDEASQQLLLAMIPGTTAPAPEAIPPLIRVVLQGQSQYGSPESDPAVFSAMRDIVEKLPNDLLKVDALIQLTIAEAETEQLNDARQSANAAYRIAFEHDTSVDFPKAMEVISYGQGVSGDLLAAFDAASRTPLPPNEEEIKAMQRLATKREKAKKMTVTPVDPNEPLKTSRYGALTRVAAIAARTEEMEIALRAATLMDLESARAAGLAAIIVAVLSPKNTINEVLADVSTAIEMEAIPSVVPPLPEIDIRLPDQNDE